MDVKFMVNEKYSFKLSNYARDLIYISNHYMSSDSNTIYNPEDIIKKEARGLAMMLTLLKYKKLV